MIKVLPKINAATTQARILPTLTEPGFGPLNLFNPLPPDTASQNSMMKKNLR